MGRAGSSAQVRIDGKAAPQVALGRIARVLWLVPAMDRLWIEGAEGRRRFLDRATLSFEPTHAEAVLTYEKAMRERNRLLKDMVRDAHWYARLRRRWPRPARRSTQPAARIGAAEGAQEMRNGVSNGADVEPPISAAPDDPDAICSLPLRQSRPRSGGRAHVDRAAPRRS